MQIHQAEVASIFPGIDFVPHRLERVDGDRRWVPTEFRIAPRCKQMSADRRCVTWIKLLRDRCEVRVDTCLVRGFIDEAG